MQADEQKNIITKACLELIKEKKVIIYRFVTILQVTSSAEPSFYFLNYFISKFFTQILNQVMQIGLVRANHRLVRLKPLGINLELYNRPII